MFWSTPVRTFDGPTHLPESISLAHLAQPRARQPVAGGNVLARAGVGGRVVALQWLQRPGWRQSSKPGLRSAGRYLGLCRHRPGCVDGSGAARYRLAYPGHHAGFCRRHDARRQFVLIDPAGHRSGTGHLRQSVACRVCRRGRPGPGRRPDDRPGPFRAARAQNSVAGVGPRPNVSIASGCSCLPSPCTTCRRAWPSASVLPTATSRSACP